MGWARKTDRNHDEVRKAFRKLGCSVLDMARLGKNAPDMCVGYGGISILVEVKDGESKDKRRREPLEGQKTFMAEWKGGCKVVLNLNDVADTVRTLKRWHCAIWGDPARADTQQAVDALPSRLVGAR